MTCLIFSKNAIKSSSVNVVAVFGAKKDICVNFKPLLSPLKLIVYRVPPSVSSDSKAAVNPLTHRRFTSKTMFEGVNDILPLRSLAVSYENYEENFRGFLLEFKRN